MAILLSPLGLLGGCGGSEVPKEEARPPWKSSFPEKNVVVIIDTSMGKIKAEIFAEKAPLSARNFLQYVDDKFYDGTIFHRVIPDFMIQGGGMEPGLKEKKTRDPIKNESKNGLSNTRGTLAMARTFIPDSATSQFFINVADNSGKLDDGKTQDGVGYAVFGRVIEGMDVVDEIRVVLTNKGDRFAQPQDVPLKDVMIKSIRRAS
jgi:peptidyl-prolyl cis-trans isomerase B (cyclophilin B)